MNDTNANPLRPQVAQHFSRDSHGGRATRNLAAALLVALTLAACGGGGGGGVDTPPSAPTPPPTDVITTPVDNTGGSSGANSGPSSQAYAVPAAFKMTGDQVVDFINGERDRSGLGALSLNGALTAAAAAHSNYLLSNGLAPSHTEDPAKAAFAGTTAGDRATALNYDWRMIAEAVAATYATDADAAANVLSIPYHRIALLDHRPLDIGAGRKTGADGTGELVTLSGYTKSALAQGMQDAAGGLSVYPAPGAANVPIISAAESPNPVPELGAWGPGAYPGYTVSVQILAHKTLSAAEFRLTSEAGVSVPVKVIDQSDTIKLAPAGIKHWAFAVPLQALAPATTYTVQFAGKADGVTISKTWSFTTRAAGVSVSSHSRVGTTTTVQWTSPGAHLNLGLVTASACGVNYTFTAKQTPTAIVITDTNGPPAAGCAFEMTVIEPVSRVQTVATVSAL